MHRLCILAIYQATRVRNIYIGCSWTVYVHVVVSVVPSRMPGCKLQRSLIIDDREIHVRAKEAERTGKRSTSDRSKQ
jgi:hypothetical protein